MPQHVGMWPPASVTRGVSARSWSRGESALPDEPPCDHHALSLHLRWPTQLAHEGLRDQAVRRLGDLNPTRLPGGLHACRRIHGVTPDVEHELRRPMTPPIIGPEFRPIR